MVSAALVVTGCSAGQDAQTVEQTPVVDGQAFQAGLIDLRDVGVRAPGVGKSYSQGGSASLEGVIVNSGRESDQLISVSSPAAASVEFFADGVTAAIALTTPSAGATSSSSALPTGTVTTAGTEPGAPSSSANSTGTPSAADSGQASASASQSASLGNTPSAVAPISSASSSAATAEPLSDIAIDPSQIVRVGYSTSDTQIVLRDLTRDLFPAETVQMTFTFAKAGAVTVTLGVKLIAGATGTAPSIDTGKLGE